MKQQTTILRGPLCSELRMCQEGCPAELSVAAITDGSVAFTLIQDGVHRAYPAALGQTIQLRDFLNRHIDELALQQTGSLAQRASDDPTQLASVEEIPHTAIGGEKLEPVRLPRGCGALMRVREQGHSKKARCGDSFGTLRNHRHLCAVCRNPEIPACTNAVEHQGSIYRCGMRSPFSRDPIICPSCCEKQKR